MNSRMLIGLSLVTVVVLVGCGTKEDVPDVTADTVTAQDKEPEPTLVCESGATAPSLRPAVGEALQPTDEVIDQTLKAESESAASARAQWAGKTFEEFLGTVKRECGDSGKYIVNGDVAYSDIKHLREFFDQVQGTLPAAVPTEIMVDGKRVRISALVLGTGALTVNTEGGQETVWSAAQKRLLSYCVHSNFNSKLAKVVTDMAAAAGAWERVADVKFLYAPEHNANCNAGNSSVVFDVRPVDVDGDYLARAFFPNEPRADRNVLIDLTALNIADGDELTLRGVLRHELGHALGFRHEHTRPQSGACFEDANINPITSYDKFSVMHYPHCNGGTSWALNLTPRDESGAACVYGAATGFMINTTLCTPRANVPIPADPPVGVSHMAQTVAKNARNSYTTLIAKPGSIVTFQMTGSGANAGDPDLYVHFGLLAPRVAPARFHCRPYLSGATETCELTVPSTPNNNRVQYLVHGYTAGAYDLVVNYVKADGT